MQTFQLRARKARALLSPSYLPWIKILTVLSRPWPRWFENQNTETMSSRKPPQSDLAAESTDLTLIVARRPRGISALLKRLEPADLVIIEATGGLEVPVASALATAGIGVAVLNPRQVRDFARATGQLAKTDALDAQVLVRFGETVKLQLRALPDAQAQALEALVNRRHQLVEMLTAEKNRRAKLAQGDP
jgi:transposase